MSEHKGRSPDDPVTGHDLATDQARQDEFERLAREDALQQVATDRMDALERVDSRRTRDATELAVQRALRDAKVDAALASHESRLNAINGSIKTFTQTLVSLDKTVSQSIAVNAAVAKKSISTRGFVLTMLSIVLPVAVYALTTIHG